ncbi:hypothetical protein UK23_28400 [Lentzea aerocolonigenes]|uniref:Uncharacterized protein n=1 Tax=Lentzea aerocolonigenes TaxID=68170 RepID=A0A0F0GRV2_LENAE|nr:hypothetical protein UK23_28400 [Lentzea aerocolonigenes]
MYRSVQQLLVGDCGELRKAAAHGEFQVAAQIQWVGRAVELTGLCSFEERWHVEWSSGEFPDCTSCHSSIRTGSSRSSSAASGSASTAAATLG